MIGEFGTLSGQSFSNLQIKLTNEANIKRVKECPQRHIWGPHVGKPSYHRRRTTLRNANSAITHRGRRSAQMYSFTRFCNNFLHKQNHYEAQYSFCNVWFSQTSPLTFAPFNTAIIFFYWTISKTYLRHFQSIYFHFHSFVTWAPYNPRHGDWGFLQHWKTGTRCLDTPSRPRRVSSATLCRREIMLFLYGEQTGMNSKTQRTRKVDNSLFFPGSECKPLLFEEKCVCMGGRAQKRAHYIFLLTSACLFVVSTPLSSVCIQFCTSEENLFDRHSNNISAKNYKTIRRPRITGSGPSGKRGIPAQLVDTANNYYHNFCDSFYATLH